MKSITRVTAIALAIIMLLPMIAFAEGGKLHDEAGLLTAEEAAAMSVMLDSASSDTGIYVGVVTVSTIGDDSVEEYADRYYHDSGMGAGDARDGVVAFVAMESRDIYIYTYGDRAIALYDDARVDTMLDNMVGALTGQQYNEAFTSFVSDALRYHESGIKADQYTYNTETDNVEQQYRDPASEQLIDPMWALASFGISLGVAALACAGVVGKYKLIFVPDSYPFRDKGSLELTRREDIFTHKHMTSRVIQQQSSGGSRSSVGGSVGGGSHGGGGRKF